MEEKRVGDEGKKGINERLKTGYTIRIRLRWGTAVAQWLRCCATNRKVAG